MKLDVKPLIYTSSFPMAFSFALIDPELKRLYDESVKHSSTLGEMARTQMKINNINEKFGDNNHCVNLKSSTMQMLDNWISELKSIPPDDSPYAKFWADFWSHVTSIDIN